MEIDWIDILHANHWFQCAHVDITDQVCVCARARSLALRMMLQRRNDIFVVKTSPSSRAIWSKLFWYAQRTCECVNVYAFTALSLFLLVSFLSTVRPIRFQCYGIPDYSNAVCRTPLAETCEEQLRNQNTFDPEATVVCRLRLVLQVNRSGRHRKSKQAPRQVL